MPNNTHTVKLLDLALATEDSNNGELGVFIIMEHV